MSTSRDVIKFGAAAAVTGLAATDFAWETGTVLKPSGSLSPLAPEHVILPNTFETGVTVAIGGRRQLVQPVSFVATLPPPFDAAIYAWGYHVRPAVIGAGSLAVSASPPTGESPAAGGRLSLTPILRQYVTIDEGMYGTPPRERPDPAIDPSLGMMVGGRVQANARPVVRLAHPIPGAPSGGMTPEVARQIVLAEVEKGAGLAEPVLVNNTRWDGPDGKNSAPVEIWESCNLMEAAEIIHFVEFQFAGRHGLDADAFRTLHGSLFPGAPYPQALDDRGVVARTGAHVRREVHVSGPGSGRPADDSFVLPPQWPFGAFAADESMTGLPGRPASADRNRTDDALGDDGTIPVGLFSIDPADGPGYVWHCHILSRQDGETGRA